MLPNISRTQPSYGTFRLLQMIQRLVNVPIEHHPNIGDRISNRYLKVMFEIPKMGHLSNPDDWPTAIPQHWPGASSPWSQGIDRFRNVETILLDLPLIYYWYNKKGYMFGSYVYIYIYTVYHAGSYIIGISNWFRYHWAADIDINEPKPGKPRRWRQTLHVPPDPRTKSPLSWRQWNYKRRGQSATATTNVTKMPSENSPGTGQRKCTYSCVPRGHLGSDSELVSKRASTNLMVSELGFGMLPKFHELPTSNPLQNS